LAFRERPSTSGRGDIIPGILELQRPGLVLPKGRRKSGVKTIIGTPLHSTVYYATVQILRSTSVCEPIEQRLEKARSLRRK